MSDPTSRLLRGSNKTNCESGYRFHRYFKQLLYTVTPIHVTLLSTIGCKYYKLHAVKYKVCSVKYSDRMFPQRLTEQCVSKDLRLLRQSSYELNGVKPFRECRSLDSLELCTFP